MKQIFPGYYRPSGEDFEKLWRNCIFVLDANVLLNLYRYPQQARDDLLKVFTRDAKRFWIPFQAALEFQRSRLGVIAAQRRKFKEVRDVVVASHTKLKTGLSGLQLERRHSSIKVDGLLRNVDKAVKEFLGELDTLEKAHPDVNQADELRKKIDDLFGERVGAPPKNQENVDVLYKEGEARFKMEIPPGFRDVDKGDSSCSFGGIVYQNKFGDFVIWKQMIDFCAKQKSKSLIFVTDDDKEDWWWTVNSEGAKRIGPRPELVEEIRRVAGVESFYIYNSEQFLRFSKEYLAAEVSEEFIQQVREVAHYQLEWPLFIVPSVATAIVSDWIVRKYSGSTLDQTPREGFPDFILEYDGARIGFEVIIPSGLTSTIAFINTASALAQRTLESGSLVKIELVGVFRSRNQIDRVVRTLRASSTRLPVNVGFTAGLAVGDAAQPEKRKFIPVSRYPDDE